MNKFDRMLLPVCMAIIVMSSAGAVVFTFLATTGILIK